MRRIALTLILFFTLLVPAQAIDMIVGVYFHDVAHFFGFTKTERGLDLGVEALFGEGILRPNVGITINARGHTSKAYAGLVLGTTKPGLFASLSLGGAVQILSLIHI